MRRILIAIAMLLAALMAGSCATSPVDVTIGIPRAVDPKAVPLGEEDVVVLGPIRRDSVAAESQTSDRYDSKQRNASNRKPNCWRIQ